MLSRITIAGSAGMPPGRKYPAMPHMSALLGHGCTRAIRRERRLTGLALHVASVGAGQHDANEFLELPDEQCPLPAAKAGELSNPARKRCGLWTESSQHATVSHSLRSER